MPIYLGIDAPSDFETLWGNTCRFRLRKCVRGGMSRRDAAVLLGTIRAEANMVRLSAFPRDESYVGRHDEQLKILEARFASRRPARGVPAAGRPAAAEG